MGYFFQGFFYMPHPTDRIAHTTAFVTLVVEHWLERELGQWVHPMRIIEVYMTGGISKKLELITLQVTEYIFQTHQLDQFYFEDNQKE